jgi:hypothetical protein
VWNVKVKGIAIIVRASEIISKLLRKCRSNKPGKHKS